MRRNVVVAVVVAVVILGMARPAHAIVPVEDIGEWALTTWAEVNRYAQMVENYLQHALMIYNQYESLKHEVQNLEKLQFHSFRDVYALLSDTENALRDGNNLMYVWDDSDRAWQETFPSDPGDYGGYAVSRARQVYRTMETLRASVAVMAGQYRHLYRGMTTLDQVKNDLKSARGAEAVSEALGELAAWQADQVATENLASQAAANAQAAAEAERIVHERQLEATFETTLVETAKAVRGARYGDDYKRYSALPDWMPL